MGFFDGKDTAVQPEIKPVSTNVEPAVTQPTPAQVIPVNYKILNTLIAERFFYVQTGMQIDKLTGALVERVTFVLSNQPGRGQQSKTIPVLFCPVTGAPLDNVDFSQLTK